MKALDQYFRRLRGGYAALFVPSVFFIAVGVFTLFAPHLVIAALASFFFFLGTVACYVAWKLVQLRRKMEKLVKNFEARILIQQKANPPTQIFEDFEVIADSQVDQKKIVVH